MSKARVSASQVKEIITTSLEDGVLLANMIDTANIFIDEHLLEVGYSDALLEKIELYLSAHFVAITEEAGAPSLSKLGDATDEWATDWFGPGFASTRYGQAALTLDSSGILAEVGSGKLRAQFRVV